MFLARVTCTRRRIMRTLLTSFTALFGGLTGALATLTLVGAVVAGVTAEFLVTDSLAVFTDQEVNAANTFTTGSVAIDDAPDSAFLTVANMMPGDSLLQPLTITNAGATEFRYALSTVADNLDAKNLRDQLSLTIRLKTANPCSTEDGAVQGADPGDRTLAGGASEVLCFKAELPLATGNTYQSAATTATFTFDAEQTANNP